ncbi:MAG: hypothetical protein KTR31_27625 [Myxococcales bacterium]|nr:hypothetical protein [Myxococcales bacterium]
MLPPTLLHDDHPMLRRIWPHEEVWPLPAAVGHVCGEAAASSLQVLDRRLQTLDLLSQHPIVAVAGMLNAGKTSVVSRFLSEDGRARAPRGLRSADGTQRFVLWLPEAWRRDETVWSALQEHLRDVFGTDTEALRADPDDAHAQYSSHGGDGSRFGVPLVATDPALDAHGFAFLDCPDVQRRHGDRPVESLRGVRLEVLGKAAQLCSAFLVVSTLDGMQDRTLHAILDELGARAPGVRRFLLLNKLRPDVAPHEAHAELQEVRQAYALAGGYGAWDFEIEGHEQWSPTDDVPGFPSFYELMPRAEDNPPHHDVDGRMLGDLPASLPVSELHREMGQGLRTSLDQQLRSAISAIESAATDSQRRVEEAQHGVLAACRHALFDRDDQLRIPVDESFLRAFVASLERTAPLYVRAFMWMNWPLRTLGRAVQAGVKKARATLAPVEAARERMMSEGRGAMVDAHALANALKGQDVDHLVATDVLGAAQRALDRFVVEHRSNPDPAELDEANRGLWKGMPMLRKATAAGAALTSLVASLVAVALIPVDFGSSVFFAASIKELLAASMMGAGMGMVMEVPLRAAMERQAGWPAFADLRALLCDELGLPRERLDEGPWALQADGRSVVLPDPEVGAGAAVDQALQLLVVDPGWSHRLEAS